MTVPVQRVSNPVVLGNHEERLRLSEFSGERWVYVGTFGVDGIDDLITPDSPPFQNGWTQAGGGEQYVSFVLRANQWTFIRGVPTGGADNTVVFTLPSAYWPQITEHFTSAGRTPGTAVTWRVEPNGDVIYETQIGSSGGGGFIQFDIDNEGDWFLLQTSGINPSTVQVGGAGGISGNWSFALNGRGGSAIGDDSNLWIQSSELFIHAQDPNPAFGGSIDIEAATGSGFGGNVTIAASDPAGTSNMQLYSAYVQFGAPTGFEVDSNGAGGGVFLYGSQNLLTMDSTGIDLIDGNVDDGGIVIRVNLDTNTGGIFIGDQGQGGIYVETLTGLGEGNGGIHLIDPGSGGVDVSTYGGFEVDDWNGVGIYLQDQSNGGVHLFSNAGTVDADADGGIFLTSNAGGNIQLVTLGGTVELYADTGGAILGFTNGGGQVYEEISGGAIVISSSGGLFLNNDGGGSPDSILISPGAGNLRFEIATGQKVVVVDNSGNPIFEVRENGDLHGKTGHSLVFDL